MLSPNSFNLPASVLSLVWQATAQDCQETLEGFEALYPQLKEGRTHGLLGHLSVVKGSQEGWETLSFVRDCNYPNPHLILTLKKTDSRVILGVISSAEEPFKEAFQIKGDHDVPFDQYVDLKGISIRVTDYYPNMPGRGWGLISPNCYLDLRHQSHKHNLRSALESDLT